MAGVLWNKKFSWTWANQNINEIKLKTSFTYTVVIIGKSPYLFNEVHIIHFGNLQ